jgi:hypothetical protein
MRTSLLLLLMTLTCQPAFASGGVHCSADADGVAIDAGGGVTRGMGGPLFSFEGTVEIGDTAIAADLAKTAFARETGWMARIYACSFIGSEKATSHTAMSN